MEDGTAGASACSWGPERFARVVEEWTQEHGVLLEGLVLVREMGEESAVSALLAVTEVRRLRLSWELWEAMQEGVTPTGDVGDVLRERLGHEELAWYRFALWGTCAQSESMSIARRPLRAVP